MKLGFYSPYFIVSKKGHAGTQLAPGYLKYAFPPVSLLHRPCAKIREDEEQVLLVAPFWLTWTWFSDLMLLTTAPPWKVDLLSVQFGTRPPRVASGRNRGPHWPSQTMIYTIHQARAPSMRQAYALRWGLFLDWCSSRQEDPQRCSTGVVLSFLQEKLECRLSPQHHLIVRFLRGGEPASSAPGGGRPSLGIALHVYVDHTQSFRYSEQLFGGQQKGNAVSKQKLAH
ncbi:hypothetical protein Q8A67_021891 [Cirrhinus molitorella]|uniref:Uncharacterized protein n=1 Tax=Cirrhinus molitorella TaxID=172907 RepID=A0AA88TN61_9TELE|nr:hypothetical protein Q8A67_021891 [Cirrhinus molitorella]